MIGASAIFLRHRFGNPAELSSHLHEVGDRVFFFYRDPLLLLPVDAPVMLDISFTSSDQQVSLRGRVLTPASDRNVRGLWLEFPDTPLARNSNPLTQRRQKRLAFDAMAQLNYANRPLLAQMVDFSLGGVRLTGCARVREGDNLTVRIISGNAAWPSEMGRAQVVRTSRTDVAAKFLRDDSSSRMAITRLFAGLQETWNKSPEVTHPPVCCQNGKILEPPLPDKVRAAQKNPGMVQKFLLGRLR